MGMSHQEHITAVFQDSQWLPIVFWEKFKLLVLTNKDLYDLGLMYLTDYLLTYVPL